MFAIRVFIIEIPHFMAETPLRVHRFFYQNFYFQNSEYLILKIYYSNEVKFCGMLYNALMTSSCHLAG